MLSFASTSPGVGGTLKVQPEHFVVTELEQVQPDGGTCLGGRDARWERSVHETGTATPSQAAPERWGEHVFVRVERKGYTTAEVQQALAALFNLRDPREVGFAGLKDKHARVRQTFSLPVGRQLTPRDVICRINETYAESSNITKSPDTAGHSKATATACCTRMCMRATRAAYHSRKLRRGQLAGNRFDVLLTGPFTASNDGAPLSLDAALARVLCIAEELERVGFPNYYGAQRFGSSGGAAAAGQRLLAEAMTGSCMPASASMSKPRLETEDEAPVVGKKRKRERKRALQKIKHSPTAQLQLNALQSELFNATLCLRLRMAPTSWWQLPGDWVAARSDEGSSSEGAIDGTVAVQVCPTCSSGCCVRLPMLGRDFWGSRRKRIDVDSNRDRFSARGEGREAHSSCAGRTWGSKGATAATTVAAGGTRRYFVAELEAAAEAIDADAVLHTSTDALESTNTSADTEARIATICRPGEGGQLARQAQAALERTCDTQVDAWCAHVLVEAVLACAGGRHRMGLSATTVIAGANTKESALVRRQPRSEVLLQALADVGLPGGLRCCRLALHWRPPLKDTGADVWALADRDTFCTYGAGEALDTAAADVEEINACRSPASATVTKFTVCKDTNGSGLRFRFMLPPGAYATSLLREFMK